MFPMLYIGIEHMRAWLVVAIGIIEWVVNSELWYALVTLSKTAEHEAISGREKRNWVLDKVFSDPDLRHSVEASGGTLLNFALEAVVLKAKLDKGKT